MRTPRVGRQAHMTPTLPSIVDQIMGATYSHVGSVFPIVELAITRTMETAEVLSIRVMSEASFILVLHVLGKGSVLRPTKHRREKRHSERLSALSRALIAI